jgi:hypothetical protein
MKSLIEQGKLLSLSAGKRAGNRTPTSVVGYQNEAGSPLGSTGSVFLQNVLRERI